MDKTAEKKIQYILENFDFESVRKIMKVLGITYGTKKVPSYYSLVMSAQNLLESVASKKDKDTWIMCGYFQAYKSTDKDDETLYELKFVPIEEDSLCYEITPDEDENDDYICEDCRNEIED